MWIQILRTIQHTFTTTHASVHVNLARVAKTKTKNTKLYLPYPVVCFSPNSARGQMRHWPDLKGFKWETVFLEAFCSFWSSGTQIFYLFQSKEDDPNWKQTWQPSAAFLPGESHGRKSLAGCSPWGYKESDRTEATEHARAVWYRMSETRHDFGSPRRGIGENINQVII